MSTPKHLTRKPRLLYLGNAFPPGVSALFPELQPAGHLIETNLIRSLNDCCETRSVGISSVDVEQLGSTTPSVSPGLPNALNLLDRPPELLNWWRALRRLRQAYKVWQHEGWSPDLIVVCNFSPVYNAFIRGIAGEGNCPYLVLYMADSTLLDAPLSCTKRLRYRLKPFKWLDNEMAELYDACVAVSAETETRFKERSKPWLWLPNGIDRARIRNASAPESGPISFGYFGHAGDHTGIHHLLKLFTAASRPAQLKVCCFGKARTQLAQQFAHAKNVSFHGPFDPEGCVDFGTSCDVLVNPRPRMPGNRNNFPSKIFEYALAGRAILSNQLSGADRILGPYAYYFDADDYHKSLGRMLDTLTQTPRAELRKRGTQVQHHLLTEYSWETQGRKLASFLDDCLAQRKSLSRTNAPATIDSSETALSLRKEVN